MCRFNSECHQIDGLCNCGKGEHCSAFTKCSNLVKPLASPPNVGAPLMNQNIMMLLYRMVQQHAELLKVVADQTSTVTAKLDAITERINAMPCKPGDSKASEVFIPSEESTSSNKLLDIICKGRSMFPYKLELTSELPSPAYKERAFSLSAMIVDKDGAQVTMPKQTIFKVLLFTTESPPKLLKLNTSGDKIMRGNIEVLSNSIVHFPKIVIKEVTSHFRNGCLFLVIAPVDDLNIQPLIVSNFVIKARKMNNDAEPRKKIKLSETA